MVRSALAAAGGSLGPVGTLGLRGCTASAGEMAADKVAGECEGSRRGPPCPSRAWAAWCGGIRSRAGGGECRYVPGGRRKCGLDCSALFPSAEEVVPPAAAGLRATAGGRCEVPERPAACVLAGHRLGRVGLRPSAPSARGAELLHPPGLEGVGGESAMGLLAGEGVSQSSITATEVELLG